IPKNDLMKFHQRIPVMANDVFASFVKKIKTDVDFASLIHAIVDGHGYSLHSKAFSYAVSMELFANMFSQGHTLRVRNPVRKGIWRSYLEKFRTIINESSELLEEEKKHVLKKVGHINQKTNKDRLIAPFEYQDIALNPEDSRILNNRNDLLHGRFPVSPEVKTLNSENEHLFYVSMRLLTLLNLGILKWVGYIGYTPNYARIYGKGKTSTADKDWFVKV
ncbi:MAG: hypothetical protein JJ975_16400, partial [Bacteroidia bacterium]|nr:hypothetical protein [Bacteroidia bacterium]